MSSFKLKRGKYPLHGLILKISTIALYRDLAGNKARKNCKFYLKKIRLNEHNMNTAGRIGSLKIEVRSSENPHNLPHFHVTGPDGTDAVYTINPLEYYLGEVEGKANKKIIKWAKLNHDVLVQMWNEYHGYRVMVS